MLAQESETRRVRDGRAVGLKGTGDVHWDRQSPLVINNNFIVSELTNPRDNLGEGRTTGNGGEYLQPRWEDAGRSTNAERGSVGSVSNDVNLVLTSTECRGGMVIKRFREQRVDGEAETKSISNRSVVSESSRLNSVSFRPYKPAEEMDDRSHASLTKDGFHQIDDTKSEQLFLVSANHRKEPNDLNLVPQKVHFGLKQSDDMSFQLRTNGHHPKTSRKNLESLAIDGHNGREGVSQSGFPLTTERSISDPRKASALIRGEIAEADLIVENWGRFEGELVDGRMNGYGRLFDRQNRLLFEGDFVDNEYEGVGILYNQSADKESLNADVWGEGRFDWRLVGNRWLKYEGLFKSGRFHGTGYLFIGGHQVLVSEFDEGQPGTEVTLRDTLTQKSFRLRGNSRSRTQSN